MESNEPATSWGGSSVKEAKMCCILGGKSTYGGVGSEGRPMALRHMEDTRWGQWRQRLWELEQFMHITNPTICDARSQDQLHNSWGCVQN